MKKIISFFLALMLCVSLTACGHKHTWLEATCTEPKTCSECGETEGEALGHDWLEATCTEAKTCSRCGETEGEALGHTLTEANYQDPAVCTVCGENVGPLTPDFVTYGIKADMEVGVHYTYETDCYDDPTKRTVGDFTVLDYNIFDSDDTHEAKDGYEWRVATFQRLNSDENIRYGISYRYCGEDYYDIRLHDDSIVYDDDVNATFTVNYHGEDMECILRQNVLSNEWRQDNGSVVLDSTLRVSYQVPVGYDGCVYGIFDAAISYPDGGHIFDVYDSDAFLLFRFA